MFHPDETLAAFVDGPSLYQTARALEMEIDYKRLLDHLGTQCRLLRASYFTTVPPSQDHVAIRPLLDWLHYNGWSVVTKPAVEFTGEDGRRRLKGNMDIELAIAAMKLAPHIDHALLFTGNRDFCPLVAFLQESGVRVTVASTLETQPVGLSDDLRRQADGFLELDQIRQSIAQPRRSEDAA
jgi:uncharacterized LabA/DUF88 family protein